MSAMASQMTGVSIVCSTVCSGGDQRKHGHRWIPLTMASDEEELRFDDVIMITE